MYAAQLRQKPEYRDLQKAIDNVNRYRALQYHQLDNLRKELENREAKNNSRSNRKKLIDYQNKINYTNEIQRIRGYLSQLGPRFTTTREALEKRKKKLIELGGKIVDNIDD
jgi:hypothetical protein